MNAETIHQSVSLAETLLPLVGPIFGAVIVKIAKKHPVVSFENRVTGRGVQVRGLFEDARGDQYVFVPQGAETHVDVSVEGQQKHIKIEEFSARNGRGGSAAITIDDNRAHFIEERQIGKQVEVREIDGVIAFYMGSMNNGQALAEFQKFIPVSEVQPPASTT